MAHTSDAHSRSAASRPRKGPLAHIRIADFCWMGVGALATRFLADMGAEVIKIEHASRLDLIRRLPVYKGEKARALGEEKTDLDPNASGVFNNYNRNKLSVSVDMRTPAGREMVERLIASSNVVSENFAPSVMDKWGLTFQRLNELSANVIYARMSGFGHSGPYASYRSYGPVVQAMSGLSYISGLPGQRPSGWGLSYMDNQAAYYNTNALLTAIYQRELTGEGCEISASAVEVGVTLVGPLMLDVAANKKSTRDGNFPMGNRPVYDKAAPHGVYPAQGDDRWVAIAVYTEAEWQALVADMGNPAWAKEPAFSTMEGRTANQPRLDQLMSDWTRSQDRHALMHRLQAKGVCAAAVQTEEDLVDHDPQLNERGVYFELDHPRAGSALFEGIPINFSRTKALNWRSSPLLGEDNDYVFKDIVGLSDGEYEQAKTAGAF